MQEQESSGNTVERLSQDEEVILAQLTKAIRTDLELFKSLLEQHPPEMADKLAKAAHELFSAAVDARDAGQAIVAAEVAAFLFVRAGNQRDSLASHLDALGVRYLLADTVQAYAEVRSDAVDTFERALDAKAGDMNFRAATLAADCAFFGAQAVERTDIASKEQWFLTCLQDLVMAVEYMASADNPLAAKEFVSLLAAATSEVMSRVLPSSEQILFDVLLRLLAAAAETHIPLDFEYLGDATKASTDMEILANLSFEYGDPTIAAARLEVAIRQAEQRKDITTWVGKSFALYRGLRHTHSTGKDLKELRQTLRGRIEEYRGQFKSRAGRLWAAQKLDDILGQLLLDDLEDRAMSQDELFGAIELNKARVLLDEIAASSRPFSNAQLASQAMEQERQLLQFASDEQPDANSALTFNMMLASLLPVGLPGFVEEQEKRRIQLDELEAFYTQHNAGFEGWANVAQLAHVMSLLKPDEALIEFCIPYWSTHPARAVWALAITSLRAALIPIPLAALPEQDFALRLSTDSQQPLDYSALGNLIVEMRTAIEQEIDAQSPAVITALQALYNLLLSPIIEHGFALGEFRHWTIVPHGPLHHVPFAALCNPSGRYLIEDIEISLAPSVSVWSALREAGRPPVASFLGLAAPDLTYTSAEPLLDSIEELDSIGKIVAPLHPIELYSVEATEDALSEQVVGKSIVHLATHGAFPEQNALDYHQILLAASEKKDGRLNAEEVRSMDFTSARLVLLSICNGSLYRFGPGDEPYGLMPAFLVAGAEHVLGTLWPVEDSKARLFMIEFYKHLLHGGPSSALHQTCRQLISDNVGVRNWCSFVLVGSGEPFDVSADI